MSATELEDAADALINLVRTNITRIKLAPDKPPEQANQFPFAATWPGRGRMTAETSGAVINVSTLILEIHVSAKNLPIAIDAVYPIVDEVKRIIFDPANIFLPDSVGQPTVETLMLSERTGGVTWLFGDLEWGDAETIGWRFEIPIKQMEVIAT